MNKLYFTISIFIIIVTLGLFISSCNLESFDMPDYNNNDYTKYDSGALDIQYHDSIENILKNDFTGNISINKTYFPAVIKTGNDVYGNNYNGIVTGNVIEIENVATQGSLLYYNPIDYSYNLQTYVPNYETATYLSRTGTFSNIAPQHYIQRVDYDDFSIKYSGFKPDTISNNIIFPNHDVRSFPSTYFTNTDVGKYVQQAEKGSEPIIYSVTLPPVTTPTPKISKGFLLVKEIVPDNAGEKKGR